MDIRNACAPQHVATMSTEQLRSNFLVDQIFRTNQVTFTYSHYDRVIIAGIVPVDQKLTLPTPKALPATHFFELREAGVVNLGDTAQVLVDGVSFIVPTESCLYIGRGVTEVIFDPPGRFYLFSAPAQVVYPTTLVSSAQSNVLELGIQDNSNRRTLTQLLYGGAVKTAQVMLGITKLHSGNMWNTMPAHTHDRRMETYLYFDLDDDARVVHLMGEPTQSRHLIVANEQAVISPNWSLHSGVGTKSYSFVWAMAGENQNFADLELVPITEIR